jgi:hypothetical protein
LLRIRAATSSLLKWGVEFFAELLSFNTERKNIESAGGRNKKVKLFFPNFFNKLTFHLTFC